jgi:hypothetical protein
MCFTTIQSKNVKQKAMEIVEEEGGIVRERGKGVYLATFEKKG